MSYEAFLAGMCGLYIGSIVGHYYGRKQTALVNKIRTLEGKAREEPAPLPTPEKPTVILGAYQPPKDTGDSVNKKQKAGIVETKTPQLLDWENRSAIEDLGKL